jgi:nickel transport protein
MAAGRMKRFFSLSLMAAALLLPAAAFAHGVEIYDLTGQAGARTLRFMYSTGESMLFAQVKVYPPSTPDATVQETMTDRDGYFSFVPFENGPWRLTVEDGMGHKGEITVAVADETETAAEAQNAAPGGKLPEGKLLKGKLPPPVAAVLGLSLILNVFGLWYAGKNKFPKRGAVHAH